VRSHFPKAAGLADVYSSLCERWVGEQMRDANETATAERLFGAFLLMPVALALVLAVGGLDGTGLAEVFSAAALLLALPMLLCAVLCLTGAARPVGIGALVAYAAGLAAAAAWTGPTPAAWLLATAIPLESWLATKRMPALLAGLAAAAPVMLLLALLSTNRDIPAIGFVASVPVALLYTASIVFRLETTVAGVRLQRAGQADAAFEAAIDGLVLRLSPEGTIREVSRKCLDLIGVSRRMLVGTALIDRIQVADRVHYLSCLADLRAGAGTAAADLRLRRAPDEKARQGVEFPTFRFEMAACRDASGSLQGFVLVARDISADLGAREASERALEEAESVQISKSRFLASVSHELRTPLNSIIGFSDILLHEMFGKFTDERQREYVELIHRSGAHLLAVVNAILDVSKIEAGSYAIVREPFAFREASEMAHAMMARQAAQKDVALVERIDSSCGEVLADRRALRQILINLVSNAVKFTDRGGVVTIDAACDGSNLVFTVSDTGIGMSDEELKKLGRPFFQIHNDYTRAYEGTGLGLSLVKGLVELHGGRLEIASRPGEGTRVTVVIPQSDLLRQPAVESAQVVAFRNSSDNGGAEIAAVRRTG